MPRISIKNKQKSINKNDVNQAMTELLTKNDALKRDNIKLKNLLNSSISDAKAHIDEFKQYHEMVEKSNTLSEEYLKNEILILQEALDAERLKNDSPEPEEKKELVVPTLIPLSSPRLRNNSPRSEEDSTSELGSNDLKPVSRLAPVPPQLSLSSFKKTRAALANLPKGPAKWKN